MSVVKVWEREVDILMKMFRKDEGFTLVELMVVVLIIGILVAIAIPVFNAASSSARQKACFSNQRVIEGAVQQYVAADPTHVIGTVALAVDTANPLVGATGYIKEVPKCTNAGADGKSYVIDGTGTTNCPDNTAAKHPHY